MDEMEKLDPNLPDALRSFLNSIAEFCVEPEWKASLNLKWRNWSESADVNMGCIRKDGGLSTEATNWEVGAERAQDYQNDLAALSGGKGVVGKSECVGPYLAASDGRSSDKGNAILPTKAVEWANGIRRFI